MQDEGLNEANEILRKAVPLMQRLNIAPTPYNYGVCYEYSSNRTPKLNKLMDATIRTLGGVPDYLTKELFHQFVIDDSQFNNEHQNKIEALIEASQKNSKEMQGSLDSLDGVLKKSKRVLERADRQKHIEKVLNYLEKGTEKAIESTVKFNENLNVVRYEIDALKSDLEALKNNIELDPLTQHYNQKGLERYMYTWKKGAEDDLSLLLIDIDKLQSINKKHGRRAGTSLIRYVGKLIKDFNVDNSVLARIDGGTYALLINELELAKASELANSIRKKISLQKIRYKDTKKEMTQLTVSVGVATLIGDESVSSLLARARVYLENAKHRGRNRTSSN
ncbi:GGDEF domain-containing protein [Marinomonas balearica]|uniref:diguanylate cyclase n=1 Tax=Marinomonas balearica TaxID=491947 RepID=A0A4R6M9D5_9GAMM|nr:GGDEF domain-containing protein [Marinomonas balearica]TDO96789.1 diguanylate cyclase [Marinomonas balearica]